MINTLAKSFSEHLSQLKSVYGNDDVDWVKYVYDHYQNIFETSSYVNLDKSEHYWEHYRIEDYLLDQHQDPNIAWIVLYINQIKSNLDFKDMDNILLPSMDTIRALRQSFMQYRSHIKACRN